MNLLVWIISLVCVTVVQSFDLGPLLRIAHCRIQCIKQHSVDDTCDWYSNRGETLCSQCWQNCESLETQWEATKFICEGDEYLRCPACQTACQYRNTRTEEEYLPSSLPAPSRGPVKAEQHDVAILLRQVGPGSRNGGWKESGFFSGNRVPSLRQDTWLIVVSEDTIRHYSWQEWTPTLESLKEGPFVEASLSWYDVGEQLRKQRDVEQKRFNDRVRQFYLEKYGEKVLVEWRSSQDTPIPEKVFRRFFFRRRSDENGQPPVDHQLKSQSQKYEEGQEEEDETYVVSWEPETGGLMGNQVVDTKFAQISLLPGTKYLVRIASNDGPGSFPIEVDTRSSAVDVWKVQKKNEEENLLPWAFLAAAFSVLFVVVIFAWVKILKPARTRKAVEEQVV